MALKCLFPALILTTMFVSTGVLAKNDLINCPPVQQIKNSASKLDKVSGPVSSKYVVTTTQVAFVDEYKQYWCLGDYIAAKDSNDALIQSIDNVANAIASAAPYADHNLCYYQGKITAIYAMVAIREGDIVHC